MTAQPHTYCEASASTCCSAVIVVLHWLATPCRGAVASATHAVGCWWTAETAGGQQKHADGGHHRSSSLPGKKLKHCQSSMRACVIIRLMPISFMPSILISFMPIGLMQHACQCKPIELTHCHTLTELASHVHISKCSCTEATSTMHHACMQIPPSHGVVQVHLYVRRCSSV